MEALVCTSLEHQTLEWQSVAAPTLDQHSVLIDVKAASVNFPDVLLIQGRYQIHKNPPFIPGMEIAGRVSVIGSAVQGFGVGDRVVAVLPQFGGFAQQVAVGPEAICKIPETLPFDVAACVPSVYATAYYALVNRAQLMAGETVLVLGAAGGVGLAAVTLAKALGARVIGATGSAEKAACVARFGADHIIDYVKNDLKQSVKDYTQGKGADIVIDPVGGTLTEQAFRAIAWGGRHLVIGFAAGDIPSVATNLLLLKSASLTGVNLGGLALRDPDAARDISQRVIRLLAEDQSMWPFISSSVPMHQGADVVAGFAQRSTMGKVVLTLGS